MRIAGTVLQERPHRPPSSGEQQSWRIARCAAGTGRRRAPGVWCGVVPAGILGPP